MDAERWGQIKNLFQEARELPVEQRKNFLAIMCSSDLALRQEVESMLAAHESADQFLAKPATEIASTILARAQHESFLGQKIGHYEILSILGVGGMGAVYRARDVRLNREVAVKILLPFFAHDAKALAQFELEAKAVAALSHPNILIIHDFGVDQNQYYSVTELLEGETLRERLTQRSLSWEEAAAIGISLANGLSAAHLKGILHRDLKPENIFLLHDGGVKILDFGLARIKSSLSPLLEATDAASFPAAAEKSSLMGTPGYVSPEQIRGEAIEAPSDLFALGCVLFEMLSGKRAFAHENIEANLQAILHEDPLQLGLLPTKLPTRLLRILARCLEKNPNERYQSALDVTLDLRATIRREETKQSLQKTLLLVLPALLLLGWLAYAALNKTILKPTKVYQSIAVLPFTTESTQSDADYLGDGFTDGLISKLAQVSHLRVLSQQAIFNYRNSQQKPEEIGRALGVQAVAVGKVIQHDNFYSIQMQLLDATTETTIWREEYNQQQLADFQVLQNKIAITSTVNLGLSLSDDERRRLGKKHTENPAAYELYLRGRSYFNQRKPEAYRKSFEYFEQALKVDTNYALAYSGLADVYIVGDLLPDKEAQGKIRSAALEALYLDNSLPEAHTSLAAVRMLYDWNWAAADREFKEALRLNPSYATGYRWYAFFLSAMGYHEAALKEIKRAEELDPDSASLQKDVALLYFFSNKDDLAIEQCLKARRLDPALADVYSLLSRIHVKRGDFSEAIKEIERAISLAPKNPTYQAYRTYILISAGERIKVRKQIAKLIQENSAGKIQPLHLASVFVALGQKSEAFALLEKAYSAHTNITNLRTSPELASLRTDVRFTDLLKRLNFPQP